MVSIVCQQIYNANADHGNFFASTTDFATTDPVGTADVEMTLTGNINALLRDQLFKVHHDATSATGPNQYEFKGAGDAWIKLHKQMWNSAMTNSTASANDGITDTFQYLTVAPDGDETSMTTWNQAWGILVGYALDPQDTNGALIKASAIAQAVDNTSGGSTGYNSTLLNDLYSSFTNVASGPTAIDTLSAKDNFLDALMIHMYATYGCTSEFKRVSGDPSDDFVSLALHENDTVSFWIKVTPVNAPVGQGEQIRHMKMNLKQDASEDGYSLSNATGQYTQTNVQNQTPLTEDSNAAGNQVQISMTGTLDSSVGGADDNEFLVGAVGASCKVMDFLKGSSTIRVTISADNVNLEINQASGNLAKDVPCNLPYADFLGKTVTAKANYKKAGDNCDVTFSLVSNDGLVFEMPVTTMEDVASLVETVLDGSWNTGAPDAWSSYDLQVAFFEIFSPQSWPAINLFNDRLYAKIHQGSCAIAVDDQDTAYAYMSTGNLQSGTETVTDVKFCLCSYYARVYLKKDGTVVAFGDSPSADVPAGLSDVKMIFETDGAYVALKNDDSAVAWGRAAAGGTAPGALNNVKMIYTTTNTFIAHHTDLSITVWGGSHSNMGNARWTVPTTNIKTVVTSAATVFLVSNNDKKPYIWFNNEVYSISSGLTVDLYPYQTHDIKDIWGESEAVQVLYTNGQCIAAYRYPWEPTAGWASGARILQAEDTQYGSGNMIVHENIKKTGFNSINIENVPLCYDAVPPEAHMLLTNDGKISIMKNNDDHNNYTLPPLQNDGVTARTWEDVINSSYEMHGIANDNGVKSIHSWGRTDNYAANATSSQVSLIETYLNNAAYEYRLTSARNGLIVLFRTAGSSDEDWIGLPYGNSGQARDFGIPTSSEIETMNGNANGDYIENLWRVHANRNVTYLKRDGTAHVIGSGWTTNGDLVGKKIKYVFGANNVIMHDVLSTTTVPE